MCHRSDVVTYDAAIGRAVVTAPPGELVTLVDNERGTRQTARRLEWDLIKDEIRLTRPGPAAAPRSGG